MTDQPTPETVVVEDGPSTEALRRAGRVLADVARRIAEEQTDDEE